MNLDQFKFTDDQAKFAQSEIERLKNLDQKSQTEQIIFDLIQSIESGNTTKLHLNSFERILKNEFKKNKVKLDLEKIKEDEKKFLATLKKDAQAKNAKDRKKREHTLISIGALFDMVDFPSEDKGIITGMLLDVMEKAKLNDSIFNQYKISGDKFITEREQQKKEKSILIDNSNTQNS